MIYILHVYLYIMLVLVEHYDTVLYILVIKGKVSVSFYISQYPSVVTYFYFVLMLLQLAVTVVKVEVLCRESPRLVYLYLNGWYHGRYFIHV